MPRWPEAFAGLALILTAAPAAAQDMNLMPAPEATIVAGGKACLGVTVDPAGQAGRLQGWSPASPAEAKQFSTDGAVLTRDHVMLVYKTGVDGGCVVMAQADAGFDRTKFYTDLSAAMGVTVAPSDQPSKVDLPNGEILVVMVSPQSPSMVQVIVANPAGKHAQKQN